MFSFSLTRGRTPQIEPLPGHRLASSQARRQGYALCSSVPRAINVWERRGADDTRRVVSAIVATLLFPSVSRSTRPREGNSYVARRKQQLASPAMEELEGRRRLLPRTATLDDEQYHETRVDDVCGRIKIGGHYRSLARRRPKSQFRIRCPTAVRRASLSHVKVRRPFLYSNGDVSAPKIIYIGFGATI